jgi:hypothetical protein
VLASRDVISDETWAVLGPLLAGVKATGRPSVDRRTVVEAAVSRFTGGQAADTPMLPDTLAEMRVAGATGRPRKRPDRLLADKGYPSEVNRVWLRERGIATTIPERDDQIAHLPKRPGRPIDFGDEQRRAVLQQAEAVAQDRDAIRQDRPQPPLWPVPRCHAPLAHEWRQCRSPMPGSS